MRSSSTSSRGRKLARWRGEVCARRRGAERFLFRSQDEKNMIFLLSRAGLRYNEKTIAPARRPSAGLVPGWGGICLAADLPGPPIVPHKGGLSRIPLCLQHFLYFEAQQLERQFPDPVGRNNAVGSP